MRNGIISNFIAYERERACARMINPWGLRVSSEDHTKISAELSERKPQSEHVDPGGVNAVDVLYGGDDCTRTCIVQVLGTRNIQKSHKSFTKQKFPYEVMCYSIAMQNNAVSYFAEGHRPQHVGRRMDFHFCGTFVLYNLQLKHVSLMGLSCVRTRGRVHTQWNCW